MSIYGSALIHFAEQFITVEHFTQVARVGSGYDKVGGSSLIQVILQAGKGKEIIGATGRLSQHAGWRTLATVDKESLWSENELKLGTYIVHPFGGGIMIIDAELTWAREAGFYAYTIEKLVGDNGIMTEELPVVGGTF